MYNVRIDALSRRGNFGLTQKEFDALREVTRQWLFQEAMIVLLMLAYDPATRAKGRAQLKAVCPNLNRMISASIKKLENREPAN